MKNLKLPITILAIVVVIITVVLLIKNQIIIPTDPPHNHFVSSGDLSFIGTSIDTFKYEEYGNGYVEARNCISLDSFEITDTIHFHHDLKLVSNCNRLILEDIEIETIFFVNGIRVTSTSNITVSVAKKNQGNTYSTVVNPDKNIIIPATGWDGPTGQCVIELSIDIDIPKTEVRPSDFLHLVFKVDEGNGFHDHSNSGLQDCTNSTCHSETDLFTKYNCFYQNQCEEAYDLAIYKLIPICVGSGDQF